VLANKANLAMGSTQKFDCKPGRSVPVLQIHGTKDELVWYKGNFAFGWDSVQASTNGWVARNNCSSTGSKVRPAPSAAAARRHRHPLPWRATLPPPARRFAAVLLPVHHSPATPRECAVSSFLPKRCVEWLCFDSESSTPTRRTKDMRAAHTV